MPMSSHDQHAPDPRDDSARRGARASWPTPPRPIERTERVAARARRTGRVLAARRSSPPHDVPPFARAAMDGYAVDRRRTPSAPAGSTRRRCAASRTVYTGQVPTRSASRAASASRSRPARRCPTAPTPSSWSRRPRRTATATSASSRPVYPRQHVGRRGADIAPGRRCSTPGDVPDPEPRRRARRPRHRPRSTSSRGRASRSSRPATRSSSPGQPLAPGQIYDINRFTLVGHRRGARRRRRSPHPTAADTPARTSTRALDGCAADDLVVFSGGSSVGERDLILDVARAAAAR